MSCRRRLLDGSQSRRPWRTEVQCNGRRRFADRVLAYFRTSGGSTELNLGRDMESGETE
jgi:hypothetical protein